MTFVTAARFVREFPQVGSRSRSGPCALGAGTRLQRQRGEIGRATPRSGWRTTRFWGPLPNRSEKVQRAVLFRGGRRSSRSEERPQGAVHSPATGACGTICFGLKHRVPPQKSARAQSPHAVCSRSGNVHACFAQPQRRACTYVKMLMILRLFADS